MVSIWYDITLDLVYCIYVGIGHFGPLHFGPYHFGPFGPVSKRHFGPSSRHFALSQKTIRPLAKDTSALLKDTSAPTTSAPTTSPLRKNLQIIKLNTISLKRIFFERNSFLLNCFFFCSWIYHYILYNYWKVPFHLDQSRLSLILKQYYNFFVCRIKEIYGENVEVMVSFHSIISLYLYIYNRSHFDGNNIQVH